MPATEPISLPAETVVVFDYGEVVSFSPSVADRAALVAVADVDPDAFWLAYWRHRDGLDEGTTAIRDYWALVAADVGARWDETTVHRLWMLDLRSWLSVDPGTLEVIRDLRAGATRLALLSNAGPDFGSIFRHGSIGPLFEAVFVSGELGLLKPGAAVFEHVLAELGITAKQMVFIDNKAINVEGARALGARGHVFTGATALRDYLRGQQEVTG